MPVTDEKAPKERDFVFLVRRLWQQPEGTALVFNCQMGRGRTSTGMIIASLLHLRQLRNPFQLPAHPEGRRPSIQGLALLHGMFLDASTLRVEDRWPTSEMFMHCVNSHRLSAL